MKSNSFLLALVAGIQHLDILGSIGSVGIVEYLGKDHPSTVQAISKPPNTENTRQLQLINCLKVAVECNHLGVAKILLGDGGGTKAFRRPACIATDCCTEPELGDDRDYEEC